MPAAHMQAEALVAHGTWQHVHLHLPAGACGWGHGVGAKFVCTTPNSQ